MKSILSVMFVAFVLSGSALGQLTQSQISKGLFNRTPRTVYYNEQMRSFLLGGGGLILADRYLSPLNYGGYTLSINSERSHFGYRSIAGVNSPWIANLLASPWRTVDARWLHHRLMSFDYGTVFSPANNASIRRLQFRWDRSLSYRMLSSRFGDFFAGGGLTAGVGGHYHSRNGNNPATAKVDFALTANIIYTYQAPWQTFPLRFTLHNTVDLFGGAFAQDFGESYYELYRHGENIFSRLHVTQPFNRFANQTRLRLDIPVWDYLIFSLGYRVQVRSWVLNHTDNCLLDHTAYVGFVTHIKPIGGRLQSTSAPLPF